MQEIRSSAQTELVVNQVWNNTRNLPNFAKRTPIFPMRFSIWSNQVSEKHFLKILWSYIMFSCHHFHGRSLVGGRRISGRFKASQLIRGHRFPNEMFDEDYVTTPRSIFRSLLLWNIFVVLSHKFYFPICWRSSQIFSVKGNKFQGKFCEVVRQVGCLVDWLSKFFQTQVISPILLISSVTHPDPFSPTATKLSSARTTLPWFPSLIQKVCSTQEHPEAAKQQQTGFINHSDFQDHVSEKERSTQERLCIHWKIRNHTKIWNGKLIRPFWESSSWGKKLGEILTIFQEINQESEFQRFQFFFVGLLGSERQDQFVWRIWIAEKGFPRKLCKDYQDVEESRSCYCD